MKFDKGRVVTWLLLLFITIMLYNIYTLIREHNLIYDDVKGSVAEQIKKEINSAIPRIKNGENGYTPIKGIDYDDGNNGRDGKNGTNGKDGYTPIKGKDYSDGKDGENGKDAPLFVPRCNPEKNRWEYHYEGDTLWMILGDEPVKCTFDSKEGV